MFQPMVFGRREAPITATERGRRMQSREVTELEVIIGGSDKDRGARDN
jgi:hypothetical protein